MKNKALFNELNAYQHIYLFIYTYYIYMAITVKNILLSPKGSQKYV